MMLLLYFCKWLISQQITATNKCSHRCGFNICQRQHLYLHYHFTLYQTTGLVIGIVSFSLLLLVSRPETPLSNGFYEAAHLANPDHYLFVHLPYRNNISAFKKGEGAALLIVTQTPVRWGGKYSCFCTGYTMNVHKKQK